VRRILLTLAPRMINYDAHEWRGHLLDLKGSMVKQIIYRVLSCAAWSAAVVTAHELLFPLAISSQGHVLIGVALGLLLVFRTNASYDRFWEGRRLWGAIVNETRNLGRSVTILLAGDTQLATRTIEWTIAFPYAVMRHLRGESGLGPRSAILPEGEVAAVAASNHPPLAIARLITAQLEEARNKGLLSDYLFVSLDQNVQLLIDYMGGCERIHKTPLPFG
jgi:putative membrane protein